LVIIYIKHLASQSCQMPEARLPSNVINAFEGSLASGNEVF